MTKGDYEGWQVAYIGTEVPCVSSTFGWKDLRRGHGDMESWVRAILAKFR